MVVVAIVIDMSPVNVTFGVLVNSDVENALVMSPENNGLVYDVQTT